MGMVVDETVIERCDFTRTTGIKAGVLTYIKDNPIKKGCNCQTTQKVPHKEQDNARRFLN